MKKFLALVILYWSFLILCPSTKAQWEGAQIQQLTDNESRNLLSRIYIDENDKLTLFYYQWNWDPEVQPYRESLFVMSKEKRGEWCSPEKIGHEPFDLWSYGRKVGYDVNTGLTHLLYFTPDWDGRDDTLYYTNSTMLDWEVVKIDSLEPGHKYVEPDMAFDSLGNVHVVWYESYSPWVQFMYINNSTGEWVKQEISLPIWVGIGGTWPAILAVQKDGTAHITHGATGASECYYVRNDSLNSENWETDTIPRPAIPLCSHRYIGLLADASDRIHLFTQGYSCVGDTIYQFYYHKQAEDTIWSEPEQVQVYPPDTGLIQEYFIDEENHIHLSLTIPGGFSVFYTNNKNGGWLEPELLLYEYDAPGAGESFRFVVDSEGWGHGVFTALDSSQGFWDDDSLEVYYLSSSNSAVDTSHDGKIFSFKLFQNYPNPFNSSTIITYETVEEGNVTLKIYDILGREVRKLVNRSQKPGHYKVNWDGRNNQGKEVASGIYFYQLTVGEAHRPEQSQGEAADYKETKKLVLMK